MSEVILVKAKHLRFRKNSEILRKLFLIIIYIKIVYV